jgi:hypothetical protein
MKTPSKIILLTAAIFLLAAGCNQNSVVSNKQTVVSNQVQQVQIYQTVEGSNLNKADGYQIEAGKIALDLLKTTHQVQTKEYAGIGEFVESIDGIKPDSNHFWAFYVNGKSFDVGASSYKPQNGDKIEWKLVKIQAY